MTPKVTRLSYVNFKYCHWQVDSQYKIIKEQIIKLQAMAQINSIEQTYKWNEQHFWGFSGSSNSSFLIQKLK